MTELLTAFGTAFTGPAAWALPAAFAWGVLSVLLSPCHLSGIPLVVAYMSGGGTYPDTHRAAGLSASFAAGTLASIAVIGAVTLAAGRMAGDVGRFGTYALAAVFFAFGLHLFGVLPLPSWTAPTLSRLKGAPGALMLGFGFGAALGPCTFAFMAPLLGIAFASGGDRARYGAALVALYGIGHAVVIVAAGTSAHGVQRWLSSRVGSAASGALRRVAGCAVMAAGLYFLFTGL